MEDYKKKYEDALERAKYWANNPTVWSSDDICQKLFPEIVEKKDEKIKACIGMCLTDASEQRFKDYDTSLKDCLAWLEKQGEQKPVDKIKPKYKVGDWIVSKYGDVFQIKEVVAGGYELLCPNGNVEINSIRNVEKNSFLWSIAYARPGDILATNLSIFIFKGFYIADKPKAYCGVMNGSFIKSPEGCWTNEQCYPATKNQRDILLTKMNDAGYAWNEEEKKTCSF